ncbi:hypothetical protein PCL_11493 [Purpureocillium lilacinum]|uniref:Uncharacterized protein n=1 Tax=Purpureocillium lilacinum TaxID=33203 RepID=A0A2U3EA65_PURLI|nr:hypothetical protein PCL_11493 [Purpureocillium lilacinum]
MMLPRDTHSDEEIDDESQISALPLLARSIPRSERAKGLLPVQLSVRFDVASPSPFGLSARDEETLFISGVHALIFLTGAPCPLALPSLPPFPATQSTVIIIVITYISSA